jgi:hypothetical protein
MKFVVASAQPIEDIAIVDNVSDCPILMISEAVADSDKVDPSATGLCSGWPRSCIRSDAGPVCPWSVRLTLADPIRESALGSETSFSAGLAGGSSDLVSEPRQQAAE